MDLNLSDGRMYKIRATRKHFPADSGHETNDFQESYGGEV